MNENILIIYNPTSGTKSSEGMISKLIDFYKSNNINYYLLKTEYQNHAQVFCKNNNLNYVPQLKKSPSPRIRREHIHLEIPDNFKLDDDNQLTSIVEEP